MEKYSREKIKQRMLKRIALLWDIPDIEHVDPIVRLLIESMAEEIFAISSQIGQMDDRLLSKLSMSMTPIKHLAARPAHAILSVEPIEEILTIDSEMVFFSKETKLLRKYDIKTIDFTPIAPFTLVKADVAFINISGQLYKNVNKHRKSAMAYADLVDEALNNNVWIGIDVDSNINKVDRLSLYFDFINIPDRYKYLQLLQHTSWSLCGKQLRAISGITKAKAEIDNCYLQTEISTMLSDLRALYDNHYMTICDVETAHKEPFPQDLASYYSEEIKSQFTKPLLWFKASFPSTFPKEVLEGLRIGLNLFPVANLSKKRAAQTMNDVLTFLPLDTSSNEFFIEMESVKDLSGKEYEPISRQNYGSDQKTTGIYSIRRGGVERFGDTNDAKSAITRLVDIIRDRTLFSYSKAEDDFNKSVSDIFTSLNKISNAMHSLGGRIDDKTYLLVDKSNQGETLQADYWVTNGAHVNDFTPEVPLSVNLNSAALSDQIHFLTPVRGGVNPADIDRIRDIHRYMLTSQDRIFTKHDIINFCKAELAEYLENVEVKGGSAISLEPNKGVIKTIDVVLSLKKNLSVEFLLEESKIHLQSKLEQRSPESFNYRLFIN